ncbi:Rho GTPase-activating protein 20, partial [Manis javanica]
MVQLNGNKGSILGMAVTTRDTADRLGVYVGVGTTGCTFLSILNTDATNTQSRQNMVIAHLVSEGRYKHFFKTKNKVPLNTVWTADSMGKANIDGQRSFVLGWPTVNFVATFRSPELKENWYSFLQRYINLAKEKDLVKRTSLKIFTEDIENCASSITVRVTNSDTVNDIINMSLPMLGITGSEKDYQLWVSSDKEKTTYPLIGHEHPYGIKMSLLPAPFVPQELQDAIFSFILKPRHLARNQQRDSRWKRVKKSVVAYLACWKSSSTSQDNPSPAPPRVKRRQLFGISMIDICDDNKLLNPILDMLAFINEKGPLTKGVFRPETNRKSCRALKKKLKSRKKVNWDGESVLVAAAVLK